MLANSFNPVFKYWPCEAETNLVFTQSEESSYENVDLRRIRNRKVPAFNFVLLHNWFIFRLFWMGGGGGRKEPVCAVRFRRAAQDPGSRPGIGRFTSCSRCPPDR